MKLLLASGNKNKLKEMQSLMAPLQIEVLCPNDVGLSDFAVEEDGATFEENALLKANAYAKAAGIPTVADDSGLCVDVLHGEPGIHSARYGGAKYDDAGRTKRLLDKMKGVPESERGAHFVSVLAFSGMGTAFTVRGECEGKITRTPKGEGGFGYDPIFLYEPLGKTFAELGNEKNTISHRAEAMKKLFVKMKENL